MTSTARSLRQTLLRRGALAGLTVLAVAVSSLLVGSGSLLATRPAAATIGSNSELAVSMAISPVNQSVNLAAQGPNHSLYFYFEVNGSWHGPLGLGGPGTTYSAPSIAAEPDGNFDIAVEGPNHTLYTYWDASGTWYGPLAIGGNGTTYSSPSIVVEPQPAAGPNNIDVIAEGASNSLYQWFNTETNATWHGPLSVEGANSTFSAPSLWTRGGTCNSTYYVDLYAQNVGPNNSVRDHSMTTYVPASGGGCTGQLGWYNNTASNDGTGFSAPTASDYYGVIQGPNHSLYQSVGGPSHGAPVYSQIEGAGTTFSTPVSTGGSYSDANVTWQGPSNSLDLIPQGGNGNIYQLGAPGTTFSAPTMAEESNDTLDFAAVGPGNSLFVYWDIGPGSYHGPLQIGAPGSTFTSDN